MSLFVWTENLSVGVAELDEQHKKLIGIINSLYEMIVKQQAGVRIEAILSELREYTGMHFAAEEKCLMQWGYPALSAHKEEHAEFAVKLDEFNTGYAAGSFSLSFQIMDFLQDWLVQHIMHTDMQYAAFLRSKK